MLKKIGIILFLILAAQYAGRPQGSAPTGLSGLAFAQQTECPPECVTDTLEIVTWYPSPYNEYEELRLYPIRDSNSQCNSDNRGLMYYDSDEDKVKLCKGPAGLNNWQDLSPSGVPAGFVGFFNLSSCPTGWSALNEARGRYLVGLPSGGTLAGTKGTALSNLEDRAVSQHSHTVNDPGHTHLVPLWHTFTRWQFSSNNGWEVGGSTGEGYMYPNNATTGITVNNAGTVAGTNAPYLQLLVCQKD